MPWEPMIINSKKTTTTAALLILTGVFLSAPAAADSGHDFIDEARLFYDAVACANGGTDARGMPARTIKVHCRELKDPVRRFQKRYVQRAARFLAKRRPAGLPTTVVYPFGGGDLVSALVSYPDAVDITTMSLEHAGDPRRFHLLRGQQLQDKLLLFRETVKGLLNLHDSTSKNLRKMEKGALPGQLSFFMLALVATGHEPVALRFFRIQDDGSLHYYSKAEIEGLEDTKIKKKERRWVDSDYSIAFSNAELQFRPIGDQSGKILVHRHIAANLDNEHFANSPLYKFLTAKGRVSTMTKAASYLLWLKDFSAIRDYLLDHMEFMFSDSTGIPPLYAKRKGMVQRTYGVFTGSFLKASQFHNEQFLKLWESQPQRGLPFRYGYTDSADNYHMMITEPRAAVRRRAAEKKAMRRAKKKAMRSTEKKAMRSTEKKAMRSTEKKAMSPTP